MLLKEKDFYALKIFSEKFLKDLRIKDAPFLSLKKILKAFKNLPYENLTKITEAEEKNYEKKLRTPYYIVKDYFEKGGGGTCFSLVYFLKKFLDFTGLKSYFVLADRNYGENTHTACIVEIKGEKYLCDIGYLIYKPIKIEEKIEFKTKAYKFIMERKDDSIYVFTLNKKGIKKFRYKIKDKPIKEDDFISAWEKSFEFEMMNHLVISKDIGKGILYLKDNHFHLIKEGKTFYKRLEEKEILDILKSINIKKELYFDIKGILINGKPFSSSPR